MTCFITVTILWIFSVCLHEFGHAVVAYYGGDTSVKEKGYLTMNPLRYTHPFYSLLLPVLFVFLGGIGLPGGAVYINDHLLRSRGWRAAVSLAGPAMNGVLILVLCLPFWTGMLAADRGNVAAISLAMLIELQISAVVFNLLPLPPLDGFRAIAPWLRGDIVDRLLAQSGNFLWLLFILLWMSPAVNRFFWGLVGSVFMGLGLDPTLARAGWAEYQFWR